MSDHKERRSRSVWREHGTAFLDWLDVDRIVLSGVDALARSLEELLSRRLDSLDAQRDFVAALEPATSRCDDPASYEMPRFVEAYAYLHLLERYRRFWDVYQHIARAFAMPLRSWAVDVLDVGTGPAPSLYALSDFYAALRTIGEVSGVSEFAACVTPPDWRVVELSER
jgi:hypothetical protein